MMDQHRCDESCRVINRDFTMVCRLTGKCFGQYMSRNYHNDDASEMILRRPAARPKRQRTGVDLSKIRPTVVSMYELLMWGAARAKLEGGAETVVTQHHRKRRRLTPAPRDDKLQRQVCDAVGHIVHAVAEHKPFLKLTTVVIGALFLMQHGKCFTSNSGTKWDIPRFVHLQCYLPSISDLPSFGFNRSLVRVGKNVIMAVLRA